MGNWERLHLGGNDEMSCVHINISLIREDVTEEEEEEEEELLPRDKRETNAEEATSILVSSTAATSPAVTMPNGST